MIRAALLSLAACVAVSCGSTQTSSPDPGAPTPVKPDDSAGRTPPAGSKPAANKTKEQLIAEAIERVPEITKTVAELRGLEMKREVPAERQTKEDFRAYLAREVEKEMPASKNAALSRAVHHIGLVEHDIDLAETMLDAFATQAAAYYDPTVNKFFIVAPFGGPGGLNMLTAHELTHGIQHQHFDLLAYYGQKPKNPLTEDELNARRFVVEGEATLLMIAFMGGGKQLLEGAGVKMLGAAIEQMAQLDTLTMIKDQKNMGASIDDPDLKAQMEAMDKIPLYVMVPLIDSYTRGAVETYRMYAAGGWKAVNELYKTPPDSTEQVLHPATKLVDKRDYPIAITLRKPTSLKGYSKVHDDVLGELIWRSYFMTWGIADPEGLAGGWDGDRVEVWTKGADSVGLIATTWDTKDDAADFARGYIESLSKRFPDAKSKTKKSITTHPRGGDAIVMVEQRGKDVLIVDGATAKVAAKAIKNLRRAKKNKRKGDDGYFEPKNKPQPKQVEKPTR